MTETAQADVARPIWDGLLGEDAEGPFLQGGHCTACGFVTLGVRDQCPECWARNTMKLVPIGRRGQVYTCTVVHQAPKGYDAPFAVAYVDVENGRNAWLIEAHIAPYAQANRYNHDPKRKRRLLLHKKQIRELWNAVRQKGMTIVPTRVYLKEGRAKIEIALVRGKRLYDKRDAVAERDMDRELRRTVKEQDYE